MKEKYIIRKFKRDIDIFPDYIKVRVMAVENETKLIRLFISKPLFIKDEWIKEQTQTKIELFINKFVSSIDLRQDYHIIEYNENLIFTKFKNGRFYNRCLINSNGKFKKEIIFYCNIL